MKALKTGLGVGLRAKLTDVRGLSVQYMLFPNKSKCEVLIKQFESRKKTKRDCDELAKLWGIMVGLREDSSQQFPEVQDRVSKMLGRWNAFRPYSREERKVDFLKPLDEDRETKEALRQIIQRTQETEDLSEVLEKERGSIERLYNFLQHAFLINSKPARIVTVSKALLMLCGFSPGFDSNVLRALKQSNRDLLACPGVWPFCVYFEALKYIADEQKFWEQSEGCPLTALRSNYQCVPIGQLIDRILFGRAALSSEWLIRRVAVSN
jgi:hypothetical protein